ncbi:MAG: DUF5320 domain-containing protein [Desulfobacteraceae bacterium]|jgi:hypothetical protein
MPRGDRSGPMGTGAMSGRAAGFCAGYHMPGYANPMNAGGAGMFAGRRRGGWQGPAGGGRGWCNRAFATGRMGRMYFGGYGYAPQPMDPESEKESLKGRTQALQSELDAINRRLTEIESQEQTT